MSDKDKQLLYSLIERLLFIHDIPAPEVHDCVSYIIIRMESPTICQENRHLKVNCIIGEENMIVRIVIYRRPMRTFGIIFSKHIKYLLKIPNQII